MSANGTNTSGLAVLNASKLPLIETYGPNSGVVVEPRSAAILARVEKLRDAFTVSQVPCDGVFQDQIGARPDLVDFSALSAQHRLGYSWAWRQQTVRAAQAGTLLMTEQGYDALMRSEVAFHGSVLGAEYSGETAGTLGNGTWYPYPFVPMVARKHTMLWQHDLDEQTFLCSMKTFSFNLLMG